MGYWGNNLFGGDAPQDSLDGYMDIFLKDCNEALLPKKYIEISSSEGMDVVFRNAIEYFYAVPRNENKDTNNPFKDSSEFIEKFNKKFLNELEKAFQAVIESKEFFMDCRNKNYKEIENRLDKNYSKYKKYESLFLNNATEKELEKFYKNNGDLTYSDVQFEHSINIATEYMLGLKITDERLQETLMLGFVSTMDIHTFNEKNTRFINVMKTFDNIIKLTDDKQLVKLNKFYKNKRNDIKIILEKNEVDNLMITKILNHIDIKFDQRILNIKLPKSKKVQKISIKI